MNDTSAVRISFPWKIFSVVLIGTFLGPIGGLMTGVALPTLSDDFRVDLQSTVWVVLSYLIATTFLLPIIGKLGTQFGLKRIYVLGFLIDIVGTVLCAVAPADNIAWLAIFRVIQAIGSVMVFALFSALITRYVPEQRRGMAFGLTGAMVATSLLIGAPLAGILCEVASWRWIFWVQVPIQLAGLVVGSFVLPAENEGEKQSYNIVSLIAWLGTTLGFAMVSEILEGGMDRGLIAVAGITWLASIVVFVLAERGRNPLFEYAIFRIRAFWTCALGLLVTNFLIQTWIIFAPYYLEDYRGMSSREMSMYLSISLLATMFSAPLAGRLVDRVGLRLPAMSGLGLSGLSMLLMAWAVSSGNLLQFAVANVLLGLGGGLFNTPALSAMMGSVPDELQAKASSISSLTRNVGFLAGASLGTILFTAFLRYSGPDGALFVLRLQDSVPNPDVIPAEAFSYSFAMLLVSCAVLVGIVTVLASRLPARVSPQG